MAIPTGGLLPRGADAVVMVEHTTEPMPGHVELLRGVAPGERRAPTGRGGRAGRRPRARRPPAARRRPRAAGRGRASPSSRPTRRPRVGIVSTGDEIVPPATAQPAPGAGARRLRAGAGRARARGGRRAGPARDRPRRRGRSSSACSPRRSARDDVVVVSAGSSVGARDLTATVVARLGEIVCHGLALKPGKPTLLADCDGVPLIGLPGNPRSALVVFRLVGIPLVRTVARHHGAAACRDRARELSRDVPSAAGRLDVVQVDGPRRRRDAALRLVRAARPDGGRRRLDPRARAGDRTRRRHRGRRRALRLRRPCRGAPRSSPTSRPARRSRPGSSGRDARGRRRGRAGRRARPRHRGAGLGAAFVARLRRLRDGRHRGARGRHGRRDRDVTRARSRATRSSTPATRSRTAATRSSCASTSTGQDGVPEVRAAAAPWQHVRTIGEDVSATELLLPEGHRLRPVDVAAAGAAGHIALTVRRAPHVVDHPDRRRGAAARLTTPPRASSSTPTRSCSPRRRARSAARVESLPVLPDDPRADRRRRRRRGRARRPRDRHRGLQRRARRLHRRRDRAGRRRCSCTASPCGPAIPSCSAGRRHRGARRAGLSRSPPR